MDPITMMMLVGAGQAASTVIPTAGDVENNRRILELEARKKAGALGLTGAEQDMLRSEMLNPVQAQARENQLRQEAAMGAMGNTSGAALNQAQQVTTDALTRASAEAGRAIAKASLDEKRAQEQELSERKAIKGSRQQERINQVAQTAGQMAGAYGAYKGYTQKGKPGELDVSGLTGPSRQLAEDINRLYRDGKLSANDLMVYSRFSGISVPPEAAPPASDIMNFYAPQP